MIIFGAFCCYMLCEFKLIYVSRVVLYSKCLVVRLLTGFKEICVAVHKLLSKYLPRFLSAGRVDYWSVQ